MTALGELLPSAHFEIYSKVPRWFFEDSVAAPFTYHSLLTDLGLVQSTPLREDLGATVRALDDFLPFDPIAIKALAARIEKSQCKLVVCDIAPLGIAVAREAAVPSCLIENFTWDWIYAGYLSEEPRLAGPAAYLKRLFGSADYHVQTEPVCEYRHADLITPPVSRPPKYSRAHTRKNLGISPHTHAVLITMGGIPGRFSSLGKLADTEDFCFIVPGAGHSVHRDGNLILLPHRSHFYHPDLMSASDIVIGKLGYSTVAEAYYARVPFGYVPRARFRESERIAAFVRSQMQGIRITEDEFERGDWVRRLDELAALPRVRRSGPNGAEAVARYLKRLVR